MLERCRAKVSQEPEPVRQRISLTSGDVRSFDLGERFALITAPFRVVQHLTSIDDQLNFLDAVSRHLAPAARLVFDVFNPKFSALVAADGVEREDTPAQQLADGRSMRRTARVKRVRWIDQVSEIELIYYITDVDGSEQRYLHAFDMRWYLCAELEHLLARAGFRMHAIYGDFDRSSLADGCAELIVTAVRR